MNAQSRFRRSALLTTLALLFILAAAAMGSERAEETPAPRWRLEQHGLPPLAPDVRAETGAQPLPAAPDALDSPYSAMAYQGFVDSNWEIFYYTDQQTAGRRLTGNGAADILPNLNRGSDQIVFASNRDGDFELFLMNRDGGNLRQLTFNSRDDVEPKWSPDGQHIAFQSYRDDNPEIYVMAADGSGQRRLTSNDDYDGMPEWSPDGGSIAFVTDRSGGYRISVMNRDGGDVRQLSTVPLSFHPTWSPDGARIAFDGDGDGDGWLDLMIMNADGSDQRVLRNPNPPTEFIAASWSPDGRQLAFLDLFWQEFQGTWYLQRAQISKHGFDSNTITSAVPGQTNLYASWETMDREAPESSVSPLPRFMPVDDFALQWSGLDMGPAGIGVYDVQYRQNGGSWTNWVAGTRATSLPFEAQSGSTYFFRSRARDSHFNVESWRDVADAFTTFYEWRFAGEITDNRGAPLAQVPLQSSGGLLQPVVTARDGTFEGYATGALPMTLLVHESGFGALPAIVADPLRHYALPLYLPPADNVLQNSTFEQPQGWTISGGLPATPTEDTATSGSASLSLGAGCVTHPCLEAGDQIPGMASGYQLLASTTDHDGALHLLWAHHNELNQQISILHRRRAPDGAWSALATLETFPPTGWALSARLVTDSAGRVHAVWHDTQGIKIASRDSQGSWSQPRVLRNLALGDAYNGVLELLVSANDHLHLFFIEGVSSYYMERRADGRWSQPQLLWAESSVHAPGLAVGPDARLHTTSLVRNAQGADELVYRWRSAGGVWSNGEIVSIPADRSFSNFRLFVDPYNTLHLLAEDFELMHRRRPASRDWTPWQRVQSNVDHNRLLEMDGSGQIHMLYSAAGEHFYRMYRPEGGWQAPTPSPLSFGALTLDVDVYQNLHVVFEDSFTNLWYGGPPLAADSGLASISQQVTVPTTLNSPTLALMARAAGDRPGDDTALTVTVDDGTQQSAPYTWTVDGRWQLYWFDMTEWAGATISVTIQLEQQAGDPLLRLWLDDVTLGSAHANPAVYIQGPSETVPGSEVRYTLTYGNVGALSAPNANLVVTLPPELAFVSADIPPSAMDPLAWHLDTLTAGQESQMELILSVDADVTPGTVVSWQAELTSDALELRTSDNQVESHLLVGYRVLLPVMRRH